MKKLFLKIKNRCINEIYEITAKHPKTFKKIVTLGVSASLFVNQTMPVATADATSKISNAIKQMVSIVSTVIMGIGIIMAIIAIFNWVSAMHEEDSARQSKSITRVIIAAILIIIKPITVMIVKAVDANQAEKYMSDWDS